MAFRAVFAWERATEFMRREAEASVQSARRRHSGSDRRWTLLTEPTPHSGKLLAAAKAFGSGGPVEQLPTQGLVVDRGLAIVPESSCFFLPAGRS